MDVTNSIWYLFCGYINLCNQVKGEIKMGYVCIFIVGLMIAYNKGYNDGNQGRF